MFCRLCVMALSVTAVAAVGTCLPDAIPKGSRKDLAGPGGSYPIGVWVNGWPAGYVTAAVVHILLEERIGFNVEETGPGPSTVDAFYALTGCASPTDIQERGCSQSMTTRNHISVEGWTESYASTWAAIQQDFPQNAPRNLGNMGYLGKTGTYVPTSIQQAAYNAEGLILEFYRGFNATWTSAARYFDAPNAVNKSQLKTCGETRLMISKVMENYANLTDDWQGVEVEEVPVRVVRGRCWDNHFWFPPSCRDDPSKCAVFFTGGSGWTLEETMQKATAWNMPLAPAVAKTWEDYTKLPSKHDSTFYWWVPDPTFLLLNPLEIAFPTFNRAAHARGDQRTAAASLSVEKYVSQDLQFLAPGAEQLIRALLIDLEAVNEMLRDQLQTGDAHWDVACRWLRSHEDIWALWLPDPTNCFAGFGLYHQASGRFVSDRQDPNGLTCQACPSGTFSSKLLDTKGLTFICLPCAVGTAQPSGASLECVPCKAGEYQNQLGSKSCKRCRAGEYQDQEGSTGCIPCPLGTSTYSSGSALLRDCGCKEGTIDISVVNASNQTDGQAKCVPCSEGLSCPLGSDLTSLRTGISSFADSEDVPQVLKGYYSTMDAPTALFQCQTSQHCPGGVPNQCSGGREVIPCAECPADTSWSDGECQPCADGIRPLWLLALCVFFLCLTVSYYVIDPKIASTATPKEAMSMISSIAIGLAQSIAIVGLTTVNWPSAFQSVSSTSQVLLLDLDDFHISCLANGPPSFRYIVTTLLFPAVVLWFILCFYLSPWLCKCKSRCWRGRRWSMPRAINTLGSCLQSGFGTMSALALKPMMCYQHPNGQSSLLKHAGVFCDTGERSTMLVAGLVLLVFFVVGFMGICSWAVYSIPKWSVTHTKRVAAFSFLVNKYTIYKWWYGVPDLARGTLLSLCPVLATDFPPAQAALLTIVISAYLLLHMRFLPWKMPVVNLLQGWVLSLLLFQVTITATFAESAGSRMDVDSFNQGVSYVVLASMALALILVSLAVLVALLDQMVNRSPTRVETLLNLGRRQNAEKLLQKMKQVAQDLLDLEAESAKSELNHLHPGDLVRISNSIDMIATDLLGTNGNEVSLNRVITFSKAHEQIRETVRNSMLSLAEFPVMETLEEMASEDEMNESEDAELRKVDESVEAGETAELVVYDETVAEDEVPEAARKSL